MHVQRWCDGREKERERKGRRHVRVPDRVAGWLQDGCRIVASCISAMCRVVTTQNGNANGGTTMQWAVNRTIVFIAIFYYNRTPFPLFSFFDSFVFSFLFLWSRSMQAWYTRFLYCSIYFESLNQFCYISNIYYRIKKRWD